LTSLGRYAPSVPCTRRLAILLAIIAPRLVRRGHYILLCAPSLRISSSTGGRPTPPTGPQGEQLFSALRVSWRSWRDAVKYVGEFPLTAVHITKKKKVNRRGAGVNHEHVFWAPCGACLKGRVQGIVHRVTAVRWSANGCLQPYLYTALYYSVASYFPVFHSS
jgi:hypothetical protein